MELLAKLQTQLDDLEARSLIRKRRTVETPCGPRLRVDGRDMLCFSSNDYLSLAGHPRVAEALREGVSLYGAGSGASHLISGHSRAHAELEERLADFVGPYLESPRALYFCTGYMANLGVLNGLAAGDKNTEIFSESLNHASLIDGARLSRTALKVYPHADVAALAVLLADSTATNKIVVTDSVFSMDGDLAPLPELLALCERHGAWLVVDDAHGFGTLGESGRGALEHFDLRSPHLVYMGTLGKAAGVGGAFVAAHKVVIETLIQKSRPYIFTTGAPPALAHALLASVDIIAGDEGRERRAHLQALVGQMERGLQLERWRLLPSRTAIQPVVIGENAETMRAATALYAQGLWVGGIRPPTVPVGTARLRVALAAGHTAAEVGQLIAALNALERTNHES
ncbi:8-amino-7-oxononanoate synthase [Pseudoduganella namucuonensis]|uniref:8-amino-7-oxononanoate synthase n=1 Tax=Pseudoduganella namucuonensis TaxID=1035707 RepID=A0A1I7G2W7_9BURK|nr:8-amino-7-oxononanoate synthase [Pseudoduganella namucuonensis]SFU42792.1 8-amino-7-oxononanoate synthase [Pseudoduganella namucuonensis]